MDAAVMSIQEPLIELYQFQQLTQELIQMISSAVYSY